MAFEYLTAEQGQYINLWMRERGEMIFSFDNNIYYLY